MAKEPIINGNVTLIEPNDININTSISNGVPFVNGIPQYQDMFIFAELTATRKGRTVLVTKDDKGYNTEKTGLEDTLKVNFIGNNQNNDNNPNYLNFTTNYYDGSNGNHIQYEGFGIQNIKVNINSSFVPQVSIQFIDVKGLAFFNQADSPYRILFDFPPPIFNLTIKGYYGKALNYQLHLVKYTSEFMSENGNFIINAEFVAVTFAPLSDILFRYVINGALINQPEPSNPNTSTEPKSTYELILKLKNLYSAISSKLKSDNETITYDNAIKTLSDIDEAYSILLNYKNELNSNGQAILLTKKADNATPSYVLRTPFLNENEEEIKLINSLNEYDSLIVNSSTTGVPNEMDDRLYIGYVIGPTTNMVSTNSITPNSITDFRPTSSNTFLSVNNVINTSLQTSDSNRIADLSKQLNDYRNSLINRTKTTLGSISSTIESDISTPSDLYSNINVIDNSQASTRYIAIDITDYYLKLYKAKIEANNSKTNSTIEISKIINSMVLERLGMRPTIYNIFKIILNDVDRFFQTLRQTAIDAENAHNDPASKSIILGGNYKDNLDKIYAFPLIIREHTVCGGISEERIAPYDLRKLTKFPEMDFIDNFIKTFFTQDRLDVLYSAKDAQNDDGSKKWIPITPYDSVLGSNTESPYVNVDVSTSSTAINLSQDSKLNQIIRIMLTRFYILSQYSLPLVFNNTTNRESIDDNYVKLFAQSEAINLAALTTNTEYGNNLKTIAANFKSNPVNFYIYVNSNIKDMYTFDEKDKLKFSLTNSDANAESITTSSDAYYDKRNVNFKGVTINPNSFVLQTLDDKSDKLIEKFKSGAQRSFWNNFFKGKGVAAYYEYTQENILIIKDSPSEGLLGSVKKIDNNSIPTRFLIDIDGKSIKLPSITDVSNGGNAKFNYNSVDENVALGAFINFDSLWIKNLTKLDTTIYDSIIKTPSRLSATIILSNFGNTLGMFNKFPRDLNRLLFMMPSMVEVPTYLPLYIGALVDAKTNGLYEELLTFFNNGAGNNFDNKGTFIFADIYDIDKYLSVNDKKVFKNAFDTFFDNGNGEFRLLLAQIQEMYNKVQKRVKNGDDREKVYTEILTSDNGGSEAGKYVKTVILPLLKRTNLIIFSQSTFQMSIPTHVGYQSLNSLNTDQKIKNINNNYFTQFFNELENQIASKEADKLKTEKEQDKLKGDEDIVTQTYYSFKNINDKWLTNPKSGDVYGYPFNDKDKSLLSSFAFVDRAMNPIGDTIINAEVLIEMLDNQDITIYSALSQLLSVNGFEFFPLQNFMSYSENSWIDSFKIDMSGIVKQSPAFICMYIGGTSSYPSTAGNGFVNDGIIDIGSTDAKDFKSDQDCNPVPSDDNQLETNPDFPYKQVRAFRVRFGEQNQSMFTSVKIDSKEYPETNESIRILSRLAGDNKLNVPTPKGQNLYNLYENRSYKATVTSLGNVMIQPTQYFQLENVPLFNGAYLIIGVEHNIEPNKMMTSFSGTKILKYPVPRVSNPVAFTGYEGGDSSNTSVGSLSAGDLIRIADAIGSVDKTQFNSMYNYNIE